jgi:hypothetical protein
VLRIGIGCDGHTIATLTTLYIERIDDVPVPSMAEVGAKMKAAANRYARVHIENRASHAAIGLAGFT